MRWLDAKLASVKTRLSNAVAKFQTTRGTATEAVEIRAEDYGYRRLTARSQDEALNPLDQDVLQVVARYLYYNNPIARRLIELPVDFGFKIGVRAEPTAHEKLQEIIDDFWLDPYNDLPNYYPQYSEIFRLHGELLLPAEVNPQNGHVSLMYRRNEDIKTLHLARKDQRWVDQIDMVDYDASTPGEKYKVIRQQTDPKVKVSIGEAEQGNKKEVDALHLRVGDAFYFRQCHLVTGRGRSPLEPVIDLIDSHDNALFDQIRSVVLQSAFVWDITLKGASKTEVDARAAEIAAAGPPPPGSVNVHNDSEIWEAKTPKLEASIATELLVQVRKIIGLALGLSETWVAASDDVNRSTAQVSDSPPLRHMERSQWTSKSMIEEMINFAIDQAIIHGRLSIDPEDKAARAFAVEMPDLTSSDNKDTAEALRFITEALALAKQNGFCDLETCREVWYRISGAERPVNLDENLKKEAAEEYPPLDLNGRIAGYAGTQPQVGTLGGTKGNQEPGST